MSRHLLRAAGLTICLIMGALRSVDRGHGDPGRLFVSASPDRRSLPVLLGIALTLLVAATIGALNGAIVSYMGISAFIATLAMESILTGTVLGISGSKSIVSGIPDTFMAIGQGGLAGIPVAVVIMLLVMLLFWAQAV
jgi:ribose transport system permease protein